MVITRIVIELFAGKNLSFYSRKYQFYCDALASR